MSPALRQTARVCGWLWLLCAWLVLTNHCALGAAQIAKAPAASRCAACAKAPAAPVKTPSVKECCQTVQAVTEGQADLVKSPAFALVEPSWVKIWAELSAQLVARVTAPGVSPPALRQTSFAEVVLQHSLLSHAPPLAA